MSSLEQDMNRVASTVGPDLKSYRAAILDLVAEITVHTEPLNLSKVERVLLDRFEDQELEEPPVVVDRHAPFLVVIAQVLRTPQAPGTATPGVDFAHCYMIPFEAFRGGRTCCSWRSISAGLSRT